MRMYLAKVKLLKWASGRRLGELSPESNEHTVAQFPQYRLSELAVRFRVAISVHIVSRAPLGFGCEKACRVRNFRAALHSPVTLQDVALQQVTMEISFTSWIECLGLLPSVERWGADLASERPQVDMDFLMTQEVFPSLVRAFTLWMMTLKRHSHMLLWSAPRSLSQTHHKNRFSIHRTIRVKLCRLHHVLWNEHNILTGVNERCGW